MRTDARVALGIPDSQFPETSLSKQAARSLDQTQQIWLGT